MGAVVVESTYLDDVRFAGAVTQPSAVSPAWDSRLRPVRRVAERVQQSTDRRSVPGAVCGHSGSVDDGSARRHEPEGW
jgi:hypothetical protein